MENVSNDKLVLEVAKYIIKKRATIAETAIHFNKSVSTIKKYINKKLPIIDIEIYNQLKEVQKEITAKKCELGGRVGKRSTIRTVEEEKKIVNYILQNDLTLEQAEEKLGIPHTTLFEICIRHDCKELRDLFYYHKTNNEGLGRK